jgi:hypothetical protein
VPAELLEWFAERPVAIGLGVLLVIVVGVIAWSYRESDDVREAGEEAGETLSSVFGGATAAVIVVGAAVVQAFLAVGDQLVLAITQLDPTVLASIGTGFVAWLGISGQIQITGLQILMVAVAFVTIAVIVERTARERGRR